MTRHAVSSDHHQARTTRHIGRRQPMIRFLCIDPNTNGGNCPALFVDDETGDLLVQGWVETDPATLTQAAEHSPLAEDEMVVRLPARMREEIMEALGGSRAVR